MSTYDNTVYLNSRLHWAEDMAAQVMRLPFEQVRFNYLINWYPKGVARYGTWKNAAEPDLDNFVAIFSSIIESGPDDAEAHALPADRQRIYIESAKAGVAAATHPYDKVGALLAVFKQYRAEVARVSTRSVTTEHNTLRNTMTELLHQYSRAALRQESGTIAPAGYTKLLRNLGQHNDVKSYLTQKHELSEWPASMANLLDHGSRMMSKWKGREDAYMSRSDALKQALKSLPAETLYLVNGPTLARFRNLTTTPRRPDFWFVLNHYLATHSDKTWNREFVADVLLRHVPSVKEPDRSDDFLLGATNPLSKALSAHRSPTSLPTYTPKLHPTLDEDEYNSEWRAAESAAWRDYRRLRRLMLEEDPRRALDAIGHPCHSDRVHALRHAPATVFDTHWQSPLTTAASKKLLDVAVPGLGDRYQIIIDVDTVMALGKDTKEAMLLEALSSINEPLKLDELALPADLSL